MSEQNYSAADLDRIFGPGAAAHAARLKSDAQETADDARAAISAGKKTAGDALDLGTDIATAAKTFYHLYVCPSAACVADANPVAGSLHQRGVNLDSATPRTDVKCPGCGQPMVIGRNGLDANGKPLPAHITEDKDGNAVFHGQPIIQPAPGQPDQTAEIEAENQR